MNIITYWKAYSLYPKISFRDRLTVSTSGHVSKKKGICAKYRERGWETVDAHDALRDGYLPDEFAIEERCLVDNHCLRVPLVSHIEPRKTMRIESVKWSQDIGMNISESQ